MKLYLKLLHAIILIVMVVSACDNDKHGTDKTSIIFKPSLSTAGIRWNEGDQLLITYSSEVASEQKVCFQYDRDGDQWHPISEKNALYLESLKEVSQVEGFGQSCDPPSSIVYSNQAERSNYLRTCHLFCGVPTLSSDGKILEAVMDSRAVHVVLKLAGELPESATVTLSGEVPVKAYKKAGVGFTVFAAHLKLWHVPGISMSSDNNVGVVAPESLFATVNYKDNDGDDKILHLYYTVNSEREIIRSDQVFLSTSFQDTDKLVVSANVGSIWTDVDSME